MGVAGELASEKKIWLDEIERSVRNRLYALR